MELPFFKYQATGNDFVMADFIVWERYLRSDIIRKICHRRFGIGADGFIAVKINQNKPHEMIYYNSDGNIGSMCGNGGRAFLKFLHDQKIIPSETWIEFLAYDGPHHGRVHYDAKNELLVELKMNHVNDIQKLNNDFILDTGSPHFVHFVNELDAIDVVKEGRNIRYSDRFKEKGINVNFVSEDAEIPNCIHLKTYERGVEDMTWSCGTGAVASVLSWAEKKTLESGNVQVQVPGGSLMVSFKKNNQTNSYQDIVLSGPAAFVFKGVYEVTA
jgi:diaminopimelate epimerase